MSDKIGTEQPPKYSEWLANFELNGYAWGLYRADCNGGGLPYMEWCKLIYNREFNTYNTDYYQASKSPFSM